MLKQGYYISYTYLEWHLLPPDKHIKMLVDEGLRGINGYISDNSLEYDHARTYEVIKHNSPYGLLDTPETIEKFVTADIDKLIAQAVAWSESYDITINIYANEISNKTNPSAKAE